MAFSKEIKGKTIMFTKGTKFLDRLNKLYKLKGDYTGGEGKMIELPAAEMAIAQLTDLTGEVDRDTLTYLLSYVAFAMQAQLKREDFVDYLDNLTDSDLIEFTRSVKAEFAEKKLIML